MRRGRQRYWCKDCHNKFEATLQTIKQKQTQQLWDRYVFEKQTLRELEEQTNLRKLAIKERFLKIKLPEKKHNPRPINLVVDSSFFGKKDKQWGVMVFRDAKGKENLWWRFVEKEKLIYYKQGHLFLLNKGYTILSVTVDGFKGLPKTFRDYPIQFCHFHQKKIVRRYVTKNPRLQAGIDLKEVTEMLGHVPEEEFKQYLKAYLYHYKTFLDEKTLNPYTRRYNFTHPKLRSAINSLIRNLLHLFTYQKYPNLNIPTTTNTLESHFSHIKDIVRIHRGLKRGIKQKMIAAILLNSSIVKPAKKSRN